VPDDNSCETVAPREAQPPFVLALDVGTSSVRAALYDSAAREVANTQSRLARRFCTTADGGAEVDAEESVNAVLQVINGCLARVSSISRIDALAVSCFWHSLVGVDASGRALTPVYGWADTRAAREVERLRARFDERETHARTGCRFHASYWPAKLLWLRYEHADTFRRVARWMSFGELLTLRLCGVTAASVSMASGTGLFDQRACVWDAPLVEFLNLRTEQLPTLAGDGERFMPAGEFATRFAVLARTRVFPAIGDGAANNVGEGCTTRARAALMVGTSAAMRVLYAGDVPDKLDSALWCYRLDRRRVCVGGALSDGGGLFDWMRRTLALDANAKESAALLDVNMKESGVSLNANAKEAVESGGESIEYGVESVESLENSVESFEEFEREVAALAPDAHGLTVLPFWAGERSAGWHAHAAGAILGLTAHTRAAEIVRAALESVAYRLAVVARALDSHAPQAEVRASGGALRRSRAWAQIIADVTNRPLRLSRFREASSRGVALLALEATGAIKSMDEIETAAGELVEPDAARHAIYQRGLERQQKFYDLLINDQKVARLLLNSSG
jgi:gluconokinase